MKKSKIFFVSSLLFVFFCFSANAQIKVSSTGKVKIGATTDATEELEVVGDSKISGHVSIGIGISPDATYHLRTFKAKFRDIYVDNNVTSVIKTEDGYYNKHLIPSVNNDCFIGTSSKAFEEIHAYSFVDHSADIREKDNIRDLGGALNIVTNLRGIKYDLKPEVVISPENRALINNESYVNKKIEQKKNQIGFIAQEVDKVLPEVVDYSDSTDTWAISYTRVIPVLVEAIKEQQTIIEELQSEVNVLKSSSLKSLSLTGIEDAQLSEQCALYQNAPNPFGETTSIRYSLPEGTTNADIIIYDMTGKQLRRIPLNKDGDSTVEVNGGEMDPGMYMYSMIVENQIIDTKQMVITQ